MHHLNFENGLIHLARGFCRLKRRSRHLRIFLARASVTEVTSASDEKNTHIYPDVVVGRKSHSSGISIVCDGSGTGIGAAIERKRKDPTRPEHYSD
jgi:hypothetical protein